MTNDKQVKQEKKQATKPAAKPVKLSAGLQKIIDSVEKLTVLELAELVKALEDKFGVSAAAPVAMAAAGNGPNGESAQAEEKSEYVVMLTATGSKKINVIKALREINQELGLKEAKDLAEAAPKEVATLKKEEAEAAKKKLEEAGAQVELK